MDTLRLIVKLTIVIIVTYFYGLLAIDLEYKYHWCNVLTVIPCLLIFCFIVDFVLNIRDYIHSTK